MGLAQTRTVPELEHALVVVVLPTTTRNLHMAVCAVQSVDSAPAAWERDLGAFVDILE